VIKDYKSFKSKDSDGGDSQKFVDYASQQIELDAELASIIADKAAEKLKLQPTALGSLRKYVDHVLTQFKVSASLDKKQKNRLIKKISTEFFDLSPNEKRELLYRGVIGYLWSINYDSPFNYSKKEKRISNSEVIKEASLLIKDIIKGKIGTNVLKYNPVYSGADSALKDILSTEDTVEKFKKKFKLKDSDINKLKDKFL
jgi:hypothetical protein